MADITFDCPECSHNLIVDATAAGLVVPCPECATQIRVPSPATEPLLPADKTTDTTDTTETTETTENTENTENAETSEPAEPDETDEPVAAPELTAAAPLTYRVLSLPVNARPDEEPLTAETVEACLNSVAQEGWQLRAATTIPVRTVQGTPQPELLLILERAP